MALLLQAGAAVTDLPTDRWGFDHVVEWFAQSFPFAASYRAGWAAAQLDGEALLMLDDQSLLEDIPIGVRTHRQVMLKKIEALRHKQDGYAGGSALSLAGTFPYNP